MYNLDNADELDRQPISCHSIQRPSWYVKPRGNTRRGSYRTYLKNLHARKLRRYYKAISQGVKARFPEPLTKWHLH